MSPSSMPWYLYALLIVGILVAGTVVVVWCRRRVNKDMNKELRMQVDTAIEHYYTFNDTEMK